MVGEYDRPFAKTHRLWRELRDFTNVVLPGKSHLTAIVAGHGGEVPVEHADLLALPGVGDYTAAAIAVFAHGRRHVVLDTNVRRVLVRVLEGREFPGTSVTKAERALAEDVLPADDATAATWSVATMELGALVCTTARPRCGACPVEDRCAWRAAGYPPYDGPPRKAQTWAGTDRQCRGRLLSVVRESDGPAHASRLDAVWADETQRTRCLESLLTDGLVVRTSDQTYALP